MKNKFIHLSTSLLLAVGLYFVISLSVSLGFIYNLNYICHYENLSYFITLPALWASFGFLAGGIWPNLPFQIVKLLYNDKEYSKDIRHIVQVTLGLSGIALWQLLPAHNLVKCTI